MIRLTQMLAAGILGFALGQSQQDVAHTVMPVKATGQPVGGVRVPKQILSQPATGCPGGQCRPQPQPYTVAPNSWPPGSFPVQ